MGVFDPADGEFAVVGGTLRRYRQSINRWEIKMAVTESELAQIPTPAAGFFVYVSDLGVTKIYNADDGWISLGTAGTPETLVEGTLVTVSGNPAFAHAAMYPSTGRFLFCTNSTAWEGTDPSALVPFDAPPFTLKALSPNAQTGSTATIFAYGTSMPGDYGWALYGGTTWLTIGNGPPAAINAAVAAIGGNGTNGPSDGGGVAVGASGAVYDNVNGGGGNWVASTAGDITSSDTLTAVGALRGATTATTPIVVVGGYNGASGKLFLSTGFDGSKYTGHTVGTGIGSLKSVTKIRGMGYQGVTGGGVLIALDALGGIFTSTNGSAWTQRTSGVVTALRDAVWLEDAAWCFVCGDAGVIKVSDDSGATWSTIATGTTDDFVCCAASAGQFAAATNTGKIFIVDAPA